MLTLAIATIVVLVAVSLALLFWPEAAPAPERDETEAPARSAGNTADEDELPADR